MAITSLVLCAACSSGGSSGGADGGSGNAFLTWADSANGVTVVDANGASFHFDADGCMYSSTTQLGPTGFCLTRSASSPTGLAAYGPTDCSNPTTNTDCDAASFDVLLTNDPAGANCIAVIGNGSATAIESMPLAVTQSNGSFLIQTNTSPSAYKAYWNGAIPGCGGSNPYAGSYTSTTTSATPSGYVVTQSGCATTGSPTSQNTGAPFVTLTIDSAGVIDSDALKITGTVSATGTGTFTSPDLSGIGDARCTPTFTITAATQGAGGKWTITGTEALAGTTYPFSLGED